MLQIDRSVLDELAAMAYAAYPLEGCGLLAGPPATAGLTTGGADGTGAAGIVTRAERFFRCRNVAESARVYTLDPRDHLHAEREAEDAGLEIIGVVHSHTHSEPYPSPTDVEQAPDPNWHYVIVGLKRAAPEFRSYRIVDGDIAEEPIDIS